MGDAFVVDGAAIDIVLAGLEPLQQRRPMYEGVALRPMLGATGVGEIGNASGQFATGEFARIADLPYGAQRPR